MFGPDLALRFRLFGIPIEVNLFFLITAVLLGRRWVDSPAMLALWVLIVFVSVLFHELGHAFTAQMFGQRPYISFHAMGGLTSWRQQAEMTPGRRLLVAVAGPAFGVAFGLAVAVAGGLFTAKGTTAYEIARMVGSINLVWAIFNLIPMLPLDGGNMMAAVFDMVAPGRGRRAARYVSIVVAAGVGVLFVVGGSFVAALLCALFIWMNVEDLRRRPQAPAPPPQPAVIDVDARVVPDPPPPPPRDAAS